MKFAVFRWTVIEYTRTWQLKGKNFVVFVIDLYCDDVIL